jgi:60Kd inner membrane protein
MELADGTTLTIAPLSLKLKVELFDLCTLGMIEVAPVLAIERFRSRPDGQHPARRKSFDRAWNATLRWRWCVLQRNAQTEGRRRMGVRCVDARTGGPIGVRRSIALYGYAEAVSWIVVRPLHDRFERNRRQLLELEPEIRRLREHHAGDKQAEQSTLADLYESRNLSPLRGCLPLLAPMVPQVAMMFASPRHQTLSEWIAGIVWVIDE